MDNVLLLPEPKSATFATFVSDNSILRPFGGSHDQDHNKYKG
jgi:hypothetical protein